MASRRQAAVQQPPSSPPDEEEAETLPAQVLGAINQNLQAIQQAMANMTQAVQAATAMGEAATAAANAAAAAAQPPIQQQQAEAPEIPEVPFVRSPFASQTGVVMDLNTKEGRKQYKDAAASLFSITEKFDVEPNKFQMFINLLHSRATELGMLGVGGNMMVPQTNGPPIDSIADYGRTKMEDVITWETTFINTPTRNSQNSKLMYDLIINSLSAQGFQRVSVWKDQFKINGKESGGCLLKVVVRESYLDSNATESTIRLNLSNLDDYIRDNGSDLVAFNAYVQSQLDGLSARGCHTTELKVNLFKGYKAVKDEDFLAYLKIIQNADEDGTNIVDAPLLMLKAVNFYKNKLTRNEWELQSESKRDILALRTEVKSLKKTKERNTSVERNSTGSPKGKKTGDKGQHKGSAGKPEKPTWLENHLKPKSDALKTGREWNNTMWYWCGEETKGKCGGKWRTHKAKDCKGLSATGSTTKEKKKEKTTGKRKRKDDSLRIATAHETLIAEKNDSSDYDT